MFSMAQYVSRKSSESQLLTSGIEMVEQWCGRPSMQDLHRHGQDIAQ